MVASISTDKLATRLNQPNPPVIIDVRREPAYLESAYILPDSVWREPESVAAWSGDFPVNRAIVVYCVHGHEVGKRVAAALTAAEFDVAYLEGGIEGWAEAGLPLTGKAMGQSR